MKSQKEKAYEYFKANYEHAKNYTPNAGNVESYYQWVDYLKYAYEALEESLARDMSTFDPD